MQRVLITGATGFIGGRLAEMLFDRGIPFTALVRTWAQAARLARLPVDLVHGDILDIESLRQAVKGCDVIMHCAVDWRGGGKVNRRSSTEGIRTILRAALEAKVQRVVFLSTMAVYGQAVRHETVDEERPCPHTGDPYSDGKIDAEKTALQYYRESGLPVTILRPTIVYGPFGRSFTVGTVTAIRERRMVLVNGGSGVCNCLYVDNLVEAMLLGAEHPDAPGGVFNISDASPVTWKDFIEGHARALGDGYLPLPEMTLAEIEAARVHARQSGPSSFTQALRLPRDPRVLEALRTVSAFARLETSAKEAAKRWLPIGAQLRLREIMASRGNAASEDVHMSVPRPLIQPSSVRLYSESRTFSIDKARRAIRYDPKVDFAEGMDRTAAWIKWARL
jgi:nucleoside-diphosphate-sugar epimerase